MKLGHRQSGVISSATWNPRDGSESLYEICLMIDIDEGCCQGFQALVNADQRVSFIGGLVWTFGVSDFDRLPGHQCYVLRSFSHHNALIDGLEAMNGRRFLKSAWARRCGVKMENLLALELRCSYEAIRASYEHRRREALADMQLRIEDFVDWEAADAS